MNNQEKARPYQIHSVKINERKLSTIQQKLIAAKIERITKNLQETISNLNALKDKRFVKMKNKPVWFDRVVAGLYPQLEKVKLPYVHSSSKHLNSFLDYNVTGMELDANNKFVKLIVADLDFYIPSAEEGNKTFTINCGNHPYVWTNGNIFYCRYNAGNFITEDYMGTNYLRCYDTRGNVRENAGNYYIIIPIHRLKYKNAQPMHFPEDIHLFLEKGLLPEELNQKAEEQYVNLMHVYDDLKEYIIWGDNTYIDISSSKLAEDMLNGSFNKTVFECNCNIKELFAPENHESLLKDQDFSNALKMLYLESDYNRASLATYPEKRITDINLGHWELVETETEGESFDLSDGHFWTARPPQLDVVKDGVCAIDFGTKSTVVVCQNREAFLLRIGKGDYLVDPNELDYENPTAVCFRDIKSFIEAYNKREGRPFTKWEDVTVSHDAENELSLQKIDSTSYCSVFRELKQWANNKNSQRALRDLKGYTEVLKPYMEDNSEDKIIDPIEIYAYYIGLYINNMYNGIYLDYILSFPVNYAREIREKIVKSFTAGIRKSLPQSILQDEETMQWFRVYAGASEPAAYAVSALQKFNLEPEDTTVGTAYGVFDFGGGTTDFDFGIERRSENLRKYKYEIEQFGSGGDALLGGENVLNLLAFEVYKDNLEEMRKNYITIVVPPECHKEAGTEMLMLESGEASQYAYMNLKCLAENMRDFWEGKNDNLFKEPLNVTFFSSNIQNDNKNKVSVKLNVKKERVEEVIRQRIEFGVSNFFEALFEAFDGRDGYGNKIHIFLAGNSCKSHFVKEIFDSKIKAIKNDIATEKKKDAGNLFVLHMPLGIESSSYAIKVDDSGSQKEENRTVVGSMDKQEAEDDKKVQVKALLNDLNQLVDDKSTEDSQELINNKAAKQNLVKAQETMNKKVTGKTGVAFGLLRCRKGGKDVRIVNNNIDSVTNEMIFPFFIGDIDENLKFHVRIGKQVGYNVWAPYCYADEEDFEIYYTALPAAIENGLSRGSVKFKKCKIKEEEVKNDDSYMIYICKIKPDTIQYAVGTQKVDEKNNEEVTPEIIGNKHTVVLD